MFDRRCCSILLPIRFHGAHAVRTDRDDLLDLRLLERGQILLGELTEDKIVAKAPHRIAGAAFFLQNAEGGSEMFHHGGERVMISRPAGS